MNLPSDHPRTRETLLAVSLTHTDVPLADQLHDAIESGADLVELRLDHVDPQAARQFLAAARGERILLTLRSRGQGGRWSGSESERVRILTELAAACPGFIDVEWVAWEDSASLRTRVADACAAGGEVGDAQTASSAIRLILSHHDLRETPPDLESLFDALCAESADIVKAVFTAADATDALRVLEQVARRAGSRPLVGLAMGEAGLATRVLAKKFGSFLSFAATERGRESAPGQPTIKALRGTYRWSTLDRDTRVYGVIGWPVHQSLSPQIHNAAMALDGINGVYLPMPVAPTYAAFERFMDFVVRSDWLDARGFSITLPHKEHALRWLKLRDQPISAMAQRCGAMNTLTRAPDEHWHGDNTDAEGALAAIEASGPSGGWRGQRVDVLGAGGAARAIAAALVDRGCTVTVYNRTAARARALAADLGCSCAPWSDRLSASGDLLVNCTRVGMSPDRESSPMPRDALRPALTVFDTVYTPARTRLLADAEAAGCRTIRGMEMFLAQARGQYRRWHGCDPSPEAFSADRR